MIKVLSTLAVLCFVLPFFLWGFMSFYSKSKRTRISHYKTIVWSAILIGITLGVVLIVIMVLVI